jgi:phage protein D
VADQGYTLRIGDTTASDEQIDAVQQLEVDDTIDRASTFRLRLAIGSVPEGDWSILADDPFPPLAPISVRLDLGGLGEHLITGYVTTVDAMLEEAPGASYLEVAGVDATVRMNLVEKVRQWKNLPDSEIARKIFDEYDLEPKVTDTSPSRQENETTTTQRGTDIRYLRRLAARNGFTCHVRTDPLLGVEEGIFGPLDLDAQAQGVLSVRFGESTNVERLSVSYRMLRPTAAEAAGVVIASKTVELATVTATAETKLGKRGTLDEIDPQPLVRPSGSGLNDAGELRGFCQGVTDRSSWAVVAEGTLKAEVYGRALRAGRPVGVRGAGSLYDGTWLVRRVLHRFAGASYTQEFELARNAIGLTGAEQLVDVGGLAAVG